MINLSASHDCGAVEVRIDARKLLYAAGWANRKML